MIIFVFLLVLLLPSWTDQLVLTPACFEIENNSTNLVLFSVSASGPNPVAFGPQTLINGTVCNKSIFKTDRVF